MMQRVADWLSLWIEFFDRFVPEERKLDAVEHRRSVLLVGLLLLLIATLPVNIVQQLRHGQFALLAISVPVLALYSGALFWYRRYGRHEAITSLLLVSGLAGVVSTCMLSGGLYSSVTPFLALLPIVALALGGRQVAIAWTLISLLSIVVFALIEGIWSPDFGDPVQYMKPVPWTVNLVLMLGYGAGITWFVERVAHVHAEHLAEARARADDANAAKTEFLANMSHELRTPMNGVLGMTQVLLADPALTARQREQLQTVHDSGQALVALLNDILDLSKVEAGKLVVEELPWAPAELLREVRSLYVDGAVTAGLQLELALDERALPAAVLGDPTRVRQVLCNLVGNAVKFTTAGGVVLGLRREGRSLHFWVQDTGPGIDPAKQEHLFEPFTQADASTARHHGGTGLGLAICRRLTDLMGGELELESALGTGSTFHLRLPLREAEVAPSETPAAPAVDDLAVLAGCSVLLVEDMPVNQVVAQAMLAALGCTVELAEDGLSARELVVSGRTWDVVLMDWHLPGMDGLDVTREARAAGYTGPIIGLSASVRDEDRRRMVLAGVDDFIGKPYTREQLGQVMARYVRRPRQSA